MTKTNTKSKATKLSDVQIAMIGPAAQREDLCVERTRASKGAAQNRAASKLIEAGVLREVRAKGNMPVWRRDEKTDLNYSLKLTLGGVRATLGNQDDARRAGPRTGAAVVMEAASTSAEGAKRSLTAAPMQTVLDNLSAPQPGAFGGETGSDIPGQLAATLLAPRQGTKIALALELIARAGGASINELIDATGWLPHTTRAALTGLRRRGYAIERKRESATTRYLVTNTLVQTAPAEPTVLSTGDADATDQRRAAGNSKPAAARAKRKSTTTMSTDPH